MYFSLVVRFTGGPLPGSIAGGGGISEPDPLDVTGDRVGGGPMAFALAAWAASLRCCQTLMVGIGAATNAVDFSLGSSFSASTPPDSPAARSVLFDVWENLSHDGSVERARDEDRSSSLAWAAGECVAGSGVEDGDGDG